MDFRNIMLMVLPPLLTALAAIEFYRHLPSVWICEYGELPEQRHRPERRCAHRKRTLAVLWAGIFVLFRAAGSLHPADRLLLIAAVLVLVPAALSDCDYMILPDQAAGAMLILGLVTGLIRPEATLRGFLAGGLLVLCLMLLSAVLSRIVTRQEGLGTGDIKLMSACGACVGALGGPRGASAALVFYALSVMSAACCFALLLLLRRSRYGEARPMGPWIAASALFSLAEGLRGGGI